ncbi:hypothetical protein SDC9_127797 [bioreactor metagenome]|uniref:Uncharacterized protein n=1 Tax=bioreactor metagenome TaxID=1076179 RepID=A0A645CV00_9ZZZZ
MQALDAAKKVALQLVVGLLQGVFLLRVAHNVPDALALGGFQLLLKVPENLAEMLRRTLRFVHVLPLPGKVLVQPVQHGGGVLPHFADIGLHHLVQPVHPDMVAGAGLQTPLVILPAAVGVL